MDAKKLLKAARKRIANEARKVARDTAKAAATTGAIMAGEAIGGPSGALAGAMLEKRLNKRIDKAVKGRGNYSVGRGNYMVGRGMYSDQNGASSTAGPITNSVINGDYLNHTPKFHSTHADDGSIIVRKREFVMSINSTGSSRFTVTSLQINPGLSSIFKFLSQLAANYVEYEVGQIFFEVKPVISSTSVSSVGSLGTVAIAVNYNSGAPNFTSFPEMVDYIGAVEGTAASHMLYGLECEPSKNANNSNLYTRSGSVPTGQDIKTYDVGKLQIGLFGIPSAYIAGTQLGLLYVSYTMKLSKPKIYSALGLTIQTDSFAGAVGCAPGLPMGTAPVKHTNNTIGGQLAKAGSSVYTFPDDFTGTVVVQAFASGTAIVMVGTSLFTSGNIVAYDLFSNVASDSNCFDASNSGIQGMISCAFTVVQATTPGSNTITYAVSSGVLTTAQLIVSEFNPSMDLLSFNNVPA